MKVKALAWMGIKTAKFQEMEHFLQDVMGLQQVHHAHDFSVFQLPSKDKVEIFGPQGPNQHFSQDFSRLWLSRRGYQAGKSGAGSKHISNWSDHCR